MEGKRKLCVQFLCPRFMFNESSTHSEILVTLLSLQTQGLTLKQCTVQECHSGKVHYPLRAVL